MTMLLVSKYSDIEDYYEFKISYFDFSLKLKVPHLLMLGYISLSTAISNISN